MAIQFTRASREKIKLKIGIDGPSGAGKTLGALALATGIAQGGKIAVADTENGSASLYADRYDFDTVQLPPDAQPEQYVEAIDAAQAAGYAVLVIDSLSHAWLSVLAAKDDYDRSSPRSNPWTNWRLFGPRWDALMQHIVQADLHVIATMRSKQAYEQVEKDGKKLVVKLGLQPQVREGAEYEFAVVFSVNQAHRAEATKDRTALFNDWIVDLTDPEIHQSLIGWMNAGTAPPPSRATPDQIARLRELCASEAISVEITETIRAAIRKGLTSERAADWIRRIEARISAGEGSSTNGAVAHA